MQFHDRGAEMRRAGVRVDLIVASLFALACGGSRDVPTAVSPASAQPRVTQSIAQAAAIAGCYSPGTTISPGPTVIVTDSKGMPVSNANVTFAVTSGRGSLEHTAVHTDATGLASAGAWELGDATGVGRVLASLDDGDGVSFSAFVSMPAKVIAVLRLDSIGGQSLPLTYSGGGSSWTITGGHYYLADNGTYDFAYESAPTVPPATICSTASYVRSATGIDFYLAPGSYPQSTFYQERNGHFAAGTLSGTTMLVKYEDPVDFDDEVYTLITGSLPAPAVNR